MTETLRHATARKARQHLQSLLAEFDNITYYQTLLNDMHLRTPDFYDAWKNLKDVKRKYSGSPSCQEGREETEAASAVYKNALWRYDRIRYIFPEATMIRSRINHSWAKVAEEEKKIQECLVENGFYIIAEGVDETHCLQELLPRLGIISSSSSSTAP